MCSRVLEGVRRFSIVHEYWPCSEEYSFSALGVQGTSRVPGRKKIMYQSSSRTKRVRRSAEFEDLPSSQGSGEFNSIDIVQVTGQVQENRRSSRYWPSSKISRVHGPA